MIRIHPGEWTVRRRQFTYRRADRLGAESQQSARRPPRSEYGARPPVACDAPVSTGSCPPWVERNLREITQHLFLEVWLKYLQGDSRGAIIDRPGGCAFRSETSSRSQRWPHSCGSRRPGRPLGRGVCLLTDPTLLVYLREPSGKRIPWPVLPVGASIQVESSVGHVGELAIPGPRPGPSPHDSIARIGTASE